LFARAAHEPLACNTYIFGGRRELELTFAGFLWAFAFSLSAVNLPAV